jgi:hypothetical protein
MLTLERLGVGVTLLWFILGISTHPKIPDLPFPDMKENLQLQGNIFLFPSFWLMKHDSFTL